MKSPHPLGTVKRESNLKREVREMSKKQEILKRAEALLNSPGVFSKQREAEVLSFIRLADALEDEKPEERASNAVVAAEIHARLNVNTVEEQFRNYIHGRESRDGYTALQTGTLPGSVVVPTGQWLHQIQTRMISASGWLRAGCEIVPTRNGRPLLNFYGDDSANVSTVLAENQPMPNANPVYTAPTAHAKSYATATPVSMQFEQDVNNGSFDLMAHLAGVFGRRTARSLNTYISNDATDGLLAKLTVGATTAGLIPTLAELSDMQSPAQLDPDYLVPESAPAYMASPALIAVLRKQTDLNGRRLYPEIQRGELLGLPLIGNVDMDMNAGDVAICAGSFKRGVHVQDAGSVIIRSTEKLAEYAQIFYGHVARYGAVIVDGNAITTLKIAAA
jgi:HK97 family phage major capsid protein